MKRVGFLFINLLCLGLLLSCSTPSSSYTVTYNPNGATGGRVPTDTNNYLQGAKVTVLGNTGNLVETGYVFAGWNTHADGKGNPYSAGATFIITSNVILFAMWTVPHVYISGQVGASSPTDNTLPVYWKDASLNYLPLSSNYQYGWASGITVDSSGNIFVVGGQYGTGGTIYGFWKNLTFTTMSDGGYSTVWDWAIAVDTSGNVWMGGMVGNSAPPPTPVYWKNGGSYSLLSSATSLGSVGADTAGNVYFTGSEGASSVCAPFYWKNGANPTALQFLSGYTYGFVNGTAADTLGNFFACGEEWDTLTAPVYWKATNSTWGAPTALPMGLYDSDSYWNVAGVAIDSSGNLDFFGYAGPTSATTLVYWKGASSTPTELSLNGNTYFHESGGMIAVDAQGNIFIAATLGSSSATTTPVYWENGGTPIVLPMGSGQYGQANGIAMGP